MMKEHVAYLLFSGRIFTQDGIATMSFIIVLKYHNKIHGLCTILRTRKGYIIRQVDDSLKLR